MTITMAPAPSKLAAPLTQTRITAGWKRKASSRITDENFVGPESNTFTKRLKLSANAAQPTSVKHRQRWPSVEEVKDEDRVSANHSPKNPNTLLEASDDTDDVEMLDNDSAPSLEEVEDDDDDDYEPEVTTPKETAEKQLGESNEMRYDTKPELTQSFH
jgi:hypothetical protein